VQFLADTRVAQRERQHHIARSDNGESLLADEPSAMKQGDGIG
jgi:hypothetical protein